MKIFIIGLSIVITLIVFVEVIIPFCILKYTYWKLYRRIKKIAKKNNSKHLKKAAELAKEIYQEFTFLGYVTGKIK